MLNNNIINEKLNQIKLSKISETLAAVHTHTHTHTWYCLLEKNKNLNVVNINNNEYINKDRTVSFFYDIGLSLCRL